MIGLTVLIMLLTLATNRGKYRITETQMRITAMIDKNEVLALVAQLDSANFVAGWFGKTESHKALIKLASIKDRNGIAWARDMRVILGRKAYYRLSKVL